MSLTLTPTLSSTSANSYVTLAFADAYWQDHYQAVKAAQWEALSDSQKTSALIQACRCLETLRFVARATKDADYELHFLRNPGVVVQTNRDVIPLRAAYNQALQFPRNIDRTDESGEYFIPESIKLAQCEQAVYLLGVDDSALATRLQGVVSESMSVGSIKVSQQFEGVGTLIGPMALEYVRPFLLTMSSTMRRG